MMIQIEKPTLRRKDMSAVLQTMVDELIGPGENSKAFLSSLCQYLQIEGFSVALRSFVDSLFYAMKALSLQPGATIGITSLSPSIYSYVASLLNLKIKIFDINPLTMSFDIDMLKGELSTIDALLIYEPYGLLTPQELYDEIEIPTIVDISQSLGCSNDEYSAGSKGDILVMSFEQGDMISTGGGGALLFRESGKESAISEDMTLLHPYIGLTDINSSLGIIQLSNLEHDILKRRAIFSSYTLAASQNKHLSFGTTSIDYQTNGYSFLLTVESKVEEAIVFAKKYEVSCSIAFPDTVIKDQLDLFERYPKSIPIIQRTIKFPLYPFLMNREIAQIEKVISQLP